MHIYPCLSRVLCVIFLSQFYLFFALDFSCKSINFKCWVPLVLLFIKTFEERLTMLSVRSTVFWSCNCKSCQHVISTHVFGLLFGHGGCQTKRTKALRHMTGTGSNYYWLGITFIIHARLLHMQQILFTCRWRYDYMVSKCRSIVSRVEIWQHVPSTWMLVEDV